MRIPLCGECKHENKINQSTKAYYKIIVHQHMMGWVDEVYTYMIGQMGIWRRQKDYDKRSKTKEGFECVWEPNASERLCIQETVHIIPSHEDQKPTDKCIISITSMPKLP